MAGMSAYVASPEEAKFTKDVNARLEKFLKDISKLQDFGEGNVGNVDRRDLTIKFVDDIMVLRK